MVNDYVGNIAMPVWATIDEAVEIINEKISTSVKASDIYRQALYGNFIFSIYFQSPVILRRVISLGNSENNKTIDMDLTERVCLLSSNNFINNDNTLLNIDTDTFSPPDYILDTPLLGHERAVVQRLLAQSLNLPSPITGQYPTHYGVIVTVNDQIYQVAEQCTRQRRIEQQIQHYPLMLASSICDAMTKSARPCPDFSDKKEYFPVYQLPDDACFVIKHSVLEQFIQTYSLAQKTSPTPRISTPLSRLLWLACKHNREIDGQLLQQPYKLLSIFEQWAKDDGITDRLSGDTLKNALERGSPV